MVKGPAIQGPGEKAFQAQEPQRPESGEQHEVFPKEKASVAGE